MKGYKNATHKYKRQISKRKFQRIFESNLDKAGVSTIFRSHNEGFVNSLQSVKVDNIIYCLFRCKKQNKSLIETYAVRYNTDYPLDHVMFQGYPNKIVIKAVDF